MRTRQTVTIIGSYSRLIQPLIKGISDGNYRLLLCNKTLEESKTMLEQIPGHQGKDLGVIDCSFDGCWEADIIIAAVRGGEELELAEKIRQVANQKILICIRDEQEAASANAFSIYNEHLSYSKLVEVSVIKTSGTNNKNGMKPDVIIKGYDDETLNTVKELFSTAGFKPQIKRVSFQGTAI